MLLNQHLKLFVCLNQLQLICNFFQNKKNIINDQLCIHQVVLLIFFWFRLLLNWVINWLIIKVFSINFDVVIFYFNSWKKIFFERINRNLIITCCIIISKNKQSFHSLITGIKSFSSVFFFISIINAYYYIVNYFVFVPINRSFKSFA